MSITIPPHFTIPANELTVRFLPSGGPGGQHANKAATRVDLTWSIAESVVLTDAQRASLTGTFGASIRVVVDTHRSQVRNREVAEERLRERIERALRPRPTRRKTKPTRSSKRRRVEHKRQRSQTKQLRKRPRMDD